MKYRVAAVSYINTLPFLKGLHSHDVQDKVDVVLAHPAQCADMLANDQVDIALCPVGALPAFATYHIITDYCIGCDGPVRTVSIFSHVPLEALSHVVMSEHSRTSNLLVQVLNAEHWHLPLTFVAPGTATQSDKDRIGYLHIGDVCFEQEKVFPYRTDLGEVWKTYTGLPFVFACWVSLRPVPEAITTLLNAAFARGLAHRDTLHTQTAFSPEVLSDYLHHNIRYAFDGLRRQAMMRFLHAARSLRPADSLIENKTNH